MPKDGPERTKPSPDSAVCSNLLLPRSTFTESTSTEPGVGPLESSPGHPKPPLWLPETSTVSSFLIHPQNHGQNHPLVGTSGWFFGVWGPRTTPERCTGRSGTSLRFIFTKFRPNRASWGRVMAKKPFQSSPKMGGVRGVCDPLMLRTCLLIFLDRGQYWRQDPPPPPYRRVLFHSLPGLLGANLGRL